MPTQKTCFVVMPIGDQKCGDTVVVESGVLREYYNFLIKKAITDARPGLKVVRADEISTRGVITDDIFTQIMNADYVIADVTYPNPNVFYELGLRHACRAGTIIIKEENSPPPPFDIAPLQYIKYKYSPKGLEELSENLESAFKSIEEDPNHPDNGFQKLAKQESYTFPDYRRQEIKTFLDKCRVNGIMEVFPTRKLGEDTSFSQAVGKAATGSTEVCLLGISLNSLFSHMGAEIASRLASPEVKLNVLLLKNDSKAAERREKIEGSSVIIEEIKHTCKTRIPSFVQQRIDKKINSSEGNRIRGLVETAEKGDDDSIKKLVKELNLKVRLYEHDPIMFMMRFDGSLFTEQYHFGRPSGQSEPCIGTYVPVIQCAEGSKAYNYLSAHFEYVWFESEEHDISHEVVFAGVREYMAHRPEI